MHTQRNAQLKTILCGPVLRHCEQQQLTIWFVSSSPLNELSLQLRFDAHVETISLNDEQLGHIKLGEHAHQYLLSVSTPILLPQDQSISYELFTAKGEPLFSTISDITYDQNETPNFVLKSTVDHLLHGSCRNPHHPSKDALVTADTQLAEELAPNERAALLMMSGDQVYIDDIAGPMLYAISQVINKLGLVQERFPDASIASSEDIRYDSSLMYLRDSKLLPHNEFPIGFHILRWYHKQPTFTSRLSHNHLVSLGEVIALYLLIWSPEFWEQIHIPETLDGLSPKHQQQWIKERDAILKFKAGLPKVRRLLAHIPTYMIFDDHDVTDDWNLSAKWEVAAYENPFSKRIIGNALIGYTLFQGMGNAPNKFHAVTTDITDLFNAPNSQKQDALIERLLRFEDWHYHLETSPRIVVLDTRTRRWRSEINLAKPSGLMDWEALMEMQQLMIGQNKVIIVSAAPMFGVKLIETIQRIATYCGLSLLVDAENWMAHQGAATSLLSIFSHRKTPQEFIILSGDVHYSFAYDINVRFRHCSPNIYQICCSGIKNQFPEKLLPIFNRLNGWLFGHFSPLNLLTKRKRMSIRGRRPNGHKSNRLVNFSGIGVVRIADNGAPSEISVIHSDGSKTSFIEPRKKSE
ncbi:alkaline phosphatase family protein [Shewanella sp. 202IG2-18]|uniref:alkaline phosphatase D family protein n=1 Tax=Parashewanella hymeniacidonis TaxID=2807618 RepID=UPI00196082A2|nr:alkaline phosphatase D family protein [Parashewanella hymeniacidonis]MBM7073166.1 alkaline phosphatase family protein [Parashewanella hymeniacidonis]